MKQVVGYIQSHHGLSERRACRITKQHRSTQRQVSTADPLTEIRQRMHEIVATRIRYGYRRVHIMLKREGLTIGRNRVYRLYKEEGLVLKNKRPRRRKMATHREARCQPRPNQAWSLDFVHDKLANGQKIRALTIVDVFTRECLAIEVGHRLQGHNVVEVLNRLVRFRGAPTALFADNVLYTERCVNLVTKSHRVSFADTFDSCPSGFRRQEMISSIANTGYARRRPSPSSIRDPKSQAEGPNIIYEVSKLPPRLIRERSFRLGSPPRRRGDRVRRD